jgi:hypothetical protein
MMLNDNFFDFLFSEAHHRCGQEVTHGNLGSRSTVNTDTALFLHPHKLPQYKLSTLMYL